MEPNLNFSILNMDKPSGPTSFQISQFVKTSLSLTKTGHGGTLDPQVSGVLPVFLGRACKLMSYFLKSDKTYVGIMRLHKDNISDSDLKKQMSLLTGKIIQTPPVKSRVKRSPREREVKQFKILERQDKDVLFISHVQAGTYIRTLCDHLGRSLGGAHMLELRRTQASIFPESESLNLYDFEKAIHSKKINKHLIPAEQAIQRVLPSIQVSQSKVKQLLIGKPLHKQDISSPLPTKEIFVLFNKNQFIGTYKKVQEGDIIARSEFIYN